MTIKGEWRCFVIRIDDDEDYSESEMKAKHCYVADEIISETCEHKIKFNND